MKSGNLVRLKSPHEPINHVSIELKEYEKSFEKASQATDISGIYPIIWYRSFANNDTRKGRGESSTDGEIHA